MKRGFAFLTGFVMLLWSLPYVLGWIIGGDNWVFSGFLLNPIDGLSYIAKMRIGWMGEWRFSLPYTAEPGQGVFLFLFYIFLGHLARIFQLPLILVFHISRLTAGLLLAWTVWIFIKVLINPNQNQRLRYYALIIIGSGLGWLFSPMIGITSDLWVAEAYPFLSGFVNPHFPLGLSLILWIIIQCSREINWRSRVLLSCEGLLLSIIMPFGVVILGVVLIGYFFWNWFTDKRVRFGGAPYVLLSGGCFLVYQYFVILSDPQLSQWNEQNVTLSPTIVDLVVSLSPALILAILYLWKFGKKEKRSQIRMMIVWLLLGAILINIPFTLQRRFMAGFFVPVAVLAMNYLETILPGRKMRLTFTLILTISILTNVVVLLTSWYGISTKSDSLYLTKNEAQAMTWLTDHVPERSLIIASPRTGTFLPAFTPHRVIYGHPFETIQAESEKRFVESVFTGLLSGENGVSQIRDRHIDYIFYGPQEAALGSPEILRQFHLVYENPEVSIFRVQP